MILLTLGVSILLIFLLMLFSQWFMNFFMKRYIGTRHHVLEELLETERVPASWSHKFDKRIAALEKRGVSQERVAALRQQAHDVYLQKLRNLALYVQKSTLVHDEETRQLLVADLERIQTKWGGLRSHAFSPSCQ